MWTYKSAVTWKGKWTVLHINLFYSENPEVLKTNLLVWMAWLFRSGKVIVSVFVIFRALFFITFDVSKVWYLSNCIMTQGWVNFPFKLVLSDESKSGFRCISSLTDSFKKWHVELWKSRKKISSPEARWIKLTCHVMTKVLTHKEEISAWSLFFVPETIKCRYGPLL